MLMYTYTLNMIQLQRQTAVLQLLAAERSGYTCSDYCCAITPGVRSTVCTYDIYIDYDVRTTST